MNIFFFFQVNRELYCLGTDSSFFYGNHNDTVDWKNLMTPVKHQNCGDCWANAGVAALEAAWAKAGNPKIVLSRQEVIDCFSCFPDCHGHNIQSGCGGGGMYVLIY